MKNSTKIIIIASILILAGVNQFVLNKKDVPDEVEKIVTPVAGSDLDEENALSTTGLAKVSEDVAETKDGETTGEALIGGEFELTDQNGNKFTQENLKGKYSVVYFGFTHCPMICPTALSTISLSLDKLGDKASNFLPVLITTDPERDTQARLKEFLANFNSSIVGLTGSKEQLDKAYKAYKVYAEKSGETKDGGYDMNHSSIIYIMDKEGKYLSHFIHETPADEIVKKLEGLNSK